MAKTNAEYQRDDRKRRADRMTALEEELARVTAERDSLRRENEGLAAECQWLSGLACRHPSGAVEGGHCHACGADVD